MYINICVSNRCNNILPIRKVTGTLKPLYLYQTIAHKFLNWKKKKNPQENQQPENTEITYSYIIPFRSFSILKNEQ